MRERAREREVSGCNHLRSIMDNDGNIGIEPGSETVYGTHDDNTMVMSEKVNRTGKFRIGMTTTQSHPHNQMRRQHRNNSKLCARNMADWFDSHRFFFFTLQTCDICIHTILKPVEVASDQMDTQTNKRTEPRNVIVSIFSFFILSHVSISHRYILKPYLDKQNFNDPNNATFMNNS